MAGSSAPISRLVTVALVLVLAVALTPVGSAAGQTAAAPQLSRAAVATGEDFAAMGYGDPWDFANPEDVRLLPDRVTPPTRNPRLEAGELRYDAAGGASLITFVFPGYGGALYMERDGGAIPIDADRYTHLALRMYSPSARATSFSYDRCLAPEGTAEFCRETTANIILEPGWNTVVEDLRTLSAGRPMPWAGKIYGFRMSNDVADGYRVAHLRLQTAPETVELTWDPSDGQTLYWDGDTDRANNTPTDPGWGVAGTGGRVSFPAGALEAGEYRFFAGASATAGGPVSAPLRVAARPAPYVLDPDLAGGEDFATAALGKPWDLSAGNDVIARGGFTQETFGPRGLEATNSGNDPFFFLRMGPGETGDLDAARYHRLTVRTTYEGPFNLSDVAGGGTHGRLLWTRSDRDQNRVIEGNKLLESREMVHYPGQASFTVDLRTPEHGPGFVMETTRPERDGWVAGSGRVTHLRYDPNEDRGPRRWRVAGIELRATDATSGGVFDIRWKDANGATGVTADLDYRLEAGGAWTPIARGVVQAADVTTHRWDTADVPPGRYLVRVTAGDGIGSASGVSTGPVDVAAGGAAPPLPSDPPADTIRISGPDRLSTAVALSRFAYPDGAPAAVLARSTQFPDALAAGPLAAAAGGPLLLNSTGALDGVVRDELRRLQVRTVYVLGGGSALSPAVIEQVEALGGIRVVRLAGPDRFATAVAAAETAVELWRTQPAQGPAGAIVALGEDFPDALAAGPLAGFSRQPLLLTGKGRVPPATLDALDAMGVRRVTVVGGENAVSAQALADLEQRGRTVSRIAGTTRFETTELLARAAVEAGADPRTVLVASGRQFPDALAAGPAAQGLGGVLLLSERDTLPDATGTWVGTRGPIALLKVAGGRAAISDAVVDQLVQLAR
jgi:putative cell wall-binding protein